MDIQVAYDASAASAPSWFKSAVSYVVSVYDALIANPIKLTFNVGWGEENGNSIATGATAQNQSVGTYLNYSALRGALASHVSDATAIANLPTSDPTNGANIYVPNAMLKTLGLMSPSLSEVDGYVGLDSSRVWSFNPGGPQAPGTFDPISILEHEFSEMLGRVGFLGSSNANGAYGPMDLFRYSAPGQRDLSPGPGSFSIDGQTMLQQFNNPLNGGDAADWSPTVVGDTFGDSTPGLAAKFSATDLTVLDVLGYTLNAPSSPPSPPSLTFDSGVTFTSPNTAVLTGTVSDPTATVGVYDGSTYVGNATVSGNGTWTLDATLSAGTHGPLTATATTGSGASASTSGTFTLQTGIKGQPYTTLEQDFDSAGNLTGEIYDKRQGSVYLQDTVQTLANGNHVVDYQSGSFFNTKSYSETKDLLTSNYQLLTQTNFNKDGSHTIIGGGVSGLTIGSVKNDTMTGGGNNETFAFKPHPGQEIITDFNAVGPGHDTISLSSSQFANVAAILANTQTVGNDAVISLSRNDSVTVQNVTAATLEAHLNDFRLHA